MCLIYINTLQTAHKKFKGYWILFLPDQAQMNS